MTNCQSSAKYLSKKDPKEKEKSDPFLDFAMFDSFSKSKSRWYLLLVVLLHRSGDIFNFSNFTLGPPRSVHLHRVKFFFNMLPVTHCSDCSASKWLTTKINWEDEIWTIAPVQTLLPGFAIWENTCVLFSGLKVIFKCFRFLGGWCLVNLNVLALSTMQFWNSR